MTTKGPNFYWGLVWTSHGWIRSCSEAIHQFLEWRSAAWIYINTLVHGLCSDSAKPMRPVRGWPS
jgi:hypothetical protein